MEADGKDETASHPLPAAHVSAERQKTSKQGVAAFTHAFGPSTSLDDNAANWGWFVDPTLWDASASTTPPKRD
jgi:hypothetical protein